MNQQEWTDQLEHEEFSDLGVCPNGPNTNFGTHTHEQHTIQVVLRGFLIVKDSHGQKTYHVGERLEVPAGTTHQAKCGPAGCTFLVGVKEEK